MHRIKECYVDSLPEGCMSCPFMYVNNNAWDSQLKRYVPIQFCVLGEEGLRPLPERWRTRRDPQCILKQIPYTSNSREHPDWKYTDNGDNEE